MGCDGGSIPRRDEMVKLKKKAEKADRDSELAARWKHCALSGEQLKKPIVACELGKLYNKESLLLALLDKKNLPEVANHIRSLKDVVELQLTPNPIYKPVAKGMSGVKLAAEYVCPVSGLEMTGLHRFVYIQGCGCVISEKAMKEVPSQNCHKCGRGYLKDEVVVLNGSEEEVKKSKELMIKRRLEAKQAKAAKRKRKAEVSSAEQESQADITNGTSCSSSAPEEELPATKKIRTSEAEPTSLTNGTTNGDHDSLSSRTNPEGKLLVKSTKPVSHRRRQLDESGGAKANGDSKLGLGSAASSIVKKAKTELDGSFKPARADPKATDAYKALFHSSEERPKDKQSHWVTFFPYH